MGPRTMRKGENAYRKTRKKCNVLEGKSLRVVTDMRQRLSFFSALKRLHLLGLGRTFLLNCDRVSCELGKNTLTHQRRLSVVLEYFWPAHISVYIFFTYPTFIIGLK